MVTVTVDDQTFAYWKQQAELSGLTVEEWLKNKTLGFDGQAEAPIGLADQGQAQSGGHGATSAEVWKKQLAEFVASHRPTGKWMDDSRESIYD